MITIEQVENHFQRNVFPRIGHQYEWRSYPDHYATNCHKEGGEVPDWILPDSPWRDNFDVAEYNRHNGVINNFWSPTIQGDKITGWEKRPGKGHTLSIWS